jgi:hypothetical protein
VNKVLFGIRGGAMNIGESVGQAGRAPGQGRDCAGRRATGLLGIYSNPGHVIADPDGEIRQEFSICFTAWIVRGQLAVADRESTGIRFVTPGRALPRPDG